ncbi:MAG: FecR family protein [Candidatus Ferrigenium altingense]
MPSTLSQPHSSVGPSAEAARWLARRRNGDCTSDEQQAFLRWLNAAEANRKAYEDAESLWQQMGGLEAIASQQLSEARAHLAQARRQPMRRRMFGFALAASVAAALVWNIGWLGLLDGQTYRTATGERQTVTLADGSQLELDTDSEVAVRYSRHNRELKLVRGQAAFTVAHGDARPFDVIADNVRIRDIGTQFDVRRHTDHVSVAVLEGAVEVSGTNATAAHPLRQGQRLSYTQQGNFSAVETVNVATVAAWREGRLVFDGQPLGEVLAELGRYHPASLTITSPAIMVVKVSGIFPTDNIELALKTIAATLPVRLTQTGPQSWQLGG